MTKSVKYNKPTQTAIIVIDMQDEFLTRAGMFKRPVDGKRLMGPLTQLLRAARTCGHRVVWVNSEYPEREQMPAPLRPPRPEGARFQGVPMNSDMLASGHAGRPCCAPGSDTRLMYVPLRPLVQPQDLQVLKSRYSAFSETGLAARLRSEGVTTLVLTGVVTNTCVRATATDAFFLGFSVILATDCVGATSSNRHREGLTAIGKHYATLRSTAQVLGDWRARVSGLGDGDSGVFYGLLPDEADQQALAAVREEVDWQHMMHRGGRVPREVAIQGTVIDGVQPLYRHPADEQPPLSPWTPAVDRLRRMAEQALGQPLNHALIQRYPDRTSNISLHADKTLDVQRGSAVVNVSLGATRTMLLQHKDRGPNRGYVTQKVDLPHGSMFVLGWETNRVFRHGIRPDRRTPTEQRGDELRDEGERISLTFRTIATFQHPDGHLSGQGARSGPPMDPDEERHALLNAFGQENRDSAFDWDQHYGLGFDRVNFKTRRNPLEEGA